MPDFTLVADSYGMAAVRAQNTVDLCASINDSFKRGESVLIEVDETEMMKSFN